MAREWNSLSKPPTRSNREVLLDPSPPELQGDFWVSRSGRHAGHSLDEVGSHRALHNGHSSIPFDGPARRQISRCTKLHLCTNRTSHNKLESEAAPALGRLRGNQQKKTAITAILESWERHQANGWSKVTLNRHWKVGGQQIWQKIWRTERRRWLPSVRCQLGRRIEDWCANED